MLKSRIPEIIGELEARMELACEAVAEAIATEAADRAPVGETGDLKRSIEGRPKADGAGVYAIFYWYFVEFGTKYAGAEPFMFPAIESLSGGIAGISRKALANL